MHLFRYESFNVTWKNQSFKGDDSKCDLHQLRKLMKVAWPSFPAWSSHWLRETQNGFRSVLASTLANGKWTTCILILRWLLIQEGAQLSRYRSHFGRLGSNSLVQYCGFQYRFVSVACSSVQSFQKSCSSIPWGWAAARCLLLTLTFYESFSSDWTSTYFQNLNIREMPSK